MASFDYTGLSNRQAIVDRLTSLANQLRSLAGTTAKMTIDEMTETVQTVGQTNKLPYSSFASRIMPSDILTHSTASYIRTWAFAGYHSEPLKLPKTVYFPEVVSIYSSAFYNIYGCETLNFPKCTTTYSRAFMFPYVGSFSALNNTLKSISFPVLSQVNGIFIYDATGLETVSVPMLQSITGDFLYGCSNVRNVYLGPYLYEYRFNYYAFCYGAPSSQVTLWVPSSAYESYLANSTWSACFSRVLSY